MSKRRGIFRDHVEVVEKVGNVSITVSGSTSTKQNVLTSLAIELATCLYTLNLPGEYKVAPLRRLIRGTSATKGLSVQGIDGSSVVIAYQPGGNDTRQTYHLRLAPERAHNMFRILKDHLGSLRSLDESGETDDIEESDVTNIESIMSAGQQIAPTVDGVVKVSTTTPFIKPTQEPKVYYTKDPDWVFTFVLLLSDIADQHPQHCVTKDQVLDLIVKRTHFRNKFGIAPIYRALCTRGYIVPVNGSDDLFTVVETPSADFKATLPQKSTTVSAEADTVPTVRQPLRQQKYLSDEEWMQSFMDGLRTLVSTNNGLVSRTDLSRYIKERTNQKKIAGTVYTVLEGLEVRGLVVTAGDKLYRVVYEPTADTLGKAVDAIGRARAETEQVFSGFAKYKQPDFAESLFSGRELLSEFLQKVQDGLTSSGALQKFLEGWYPGFHFTSYIRLFNYMIGQGYLVRPMHGAYALGPKGRELLGLPAVEYTTLEPAQEPDMVESPAEEEAVVEVEVTPPVVPTPPEVLQAPAVFLPDVAVPEAPPIKAVLEATAQAIRKAGEKKVAAEAAEATLATLEARHAELLARKAAGPSPAAVEAAVMAKLIAMAHDL